MPRSITVSEITKSFGRKLVLNRVNLDVRKGEIFGLLGPSGAGKTTLIKILTGQLLQDRGTVNIYNTDTRHLSGDSRKCFGITMDDFGVYERLSCYENLKIFAELYGAAKDEINKALTKVGLAGESKTAAGKLSKGMRGRLKLARVFMADPDILFLDEPTSGLDPVSADAIHKMIITEKAHGKTVFLTTHSMAEAEKLCNHIALLHDGKIVESGEPKEICRRHDHQRKLIVHLRDGRDLEIPHEKQSAGIIEEFIRTGAAETIHSSEPDLEAVFMELTGRELSL
ncbi:MAG: ABC transporter ATP-binding protein [Lachnospiraceae bacterium]|nr:ABC transporter ATP-binding protein [Lachnospiraceae bacterium]